MRNAILFRSGFDFLHAGDRVVSQTHTFIVLGLESADHPFESTNGLPRFSRRSNFAGMVLVVKLIEFVSRLKNSSFRVTGKGVVLLASFPLPK